MSVEVALGRRFLEVDENRRLAGLGVALDVVEVRGLLELLFEPVRHLLQRVGRGGARPVCLDHHGLHGEIGIFLAAEPLIGAHAADDADQHEEDDEGAVVDGPFGKIEACHHLTSVSGLTSWPSASELTPAVTTFSPADSPWLTTTESPSNLSELDLAALHLVVLADHPDLRLVSRLQQRARRQARSLLAFGFDAADHDWPEAHLRRRRRQRHLHLIGAGRAVGLGRDLADRAGDGDVGAALQRYASPPCRALPGRCRRRRQRRPPRARRCAEISTTIWPADHDLTRVGSGRRHDAVVGRHELGVAELVLGDAEIGFGRLDRRLGALQRFQRVHHTGSVWRSPCRAGCESVAPGPRPGSSAALAAARSASAAVTLFW